MAIPISTPTTPELYLKSFTGVSGDHFQVVGAVPFPRTPVAATIANSQMNVTSTVLLLNNFKPTGATHAEIAVESNPIRW
jgi:hypothetical protein